MPPRKQTLARWAAALCLAGAGRAAADPLELAGWLAPTGSLWQQSAGALVDGPPAAFAWADATRRLARAPAGACTFLGLRTWGSTLQVSDGRPLGLEVVLYERGDAGELGREDYVRLVRDTVAVVERWAGAPGQKADDELRTAGVRRDALLWVRNGTRVRLACSHSTKDREGAFAFRAEYVRLAFAPATPGSARTAPPGAPARKAESRANGDVVLTGIPMVDQGEKGYCSVATVERIARYFGLSLDQHELAQLGASDPSSGTDARFLMEALQRVGPRIGLRTRVLDEFKLNDITRLLDRYNREARRADRPELATGQVIDLGVLYRQMEFPFLREARNKDGGGRKAMLTDIQKALAEGVPVLWSVVLGKVDEQPPLPQASGGHMRLIIGCNPRTGEILYSDTWGPGHEEKRMSLENAWAISLGRYRIEPR
jgi:hypothetical protein